VPRLSIVIPALGSFDLLETTLLSVFDHRPDDCEIVVVHRGDYADPYELDGEVRFVIADAQDWISAANAGIAAAGAPIVHLLARGVEVEEAWTDRPLNRFANPNVAAVSLPVLGCVDREAIEATEESAGLRKLPADQPAVSSESLWWAGFYRREALDRWAVPFDRGSGESVADWDLSLRLQSAGLATVREHNSRVWADLARLPRQGLWRRTWQTVRLARRHATEADDAADEIPLIACTRFDALLAFGCSLFGSDRGLKRLERRVGDAFAAYTEEIGKGKATALRRGSSSGSSRLDASHGVANDRGNARSRPSDPMRNFTL